MYDITSYTITSKLIILSEQEEAICVWGDINRTTYLSMFSSLQDISGSWTNASNVATKLSLFSRNTHMTFAEQKRRKKKKKEEKRRDEMRLD